MRKIMILLLVLVLASCSISIKQGIVYGGSYVVDEVEVKYKSSVGTAIEDAYKYRVHAKHVEFDEDLTLYTNTLYGLGDTLRIK